MMVFFGLYTIVDTIFIARFVNTDALSALNIVTPAINVVVGLGTMLATGGSAIVARKLGGGMDAEARGNLSLLVLAGVAIGLVLAGLGLLFAEELAVLLGASEILLPYAASYLSILLVFAPANVLQVLFAVFFVTAGRPGLGMVAGVSGGVANAVLDYLFMGPLDMGIAGAAVATGIGYLVPVIIGVSFFWRNRRGTLYFTATRFDGRVLGESCINGSSEMVAQLSAAVTTFFLNAAMMKLLGENGVAAITIIIYSQFLLITLFIGFSMGVAPVISYNYGSGNDGQLRRMLKICLGTITVCSLVIFTATCLGGPALMQAFSPPGTEVYAISSGGFAIFRFSFLLCGFNIFASALFTALSNGPVSAVISFARTFGFLLMGILLLPLYFGVAGIWVTIPLAELLTFGLSVLLFWKNRSRYRYF